MSERFETQVGRMQVRRAFTPPAADIEWKKAERPRPGEHLMRNLAVASALVICAVTLRSGALPVLSPAADAVLAAATTDTLLDDPLGRLSFVSSIFPETALVFADAAPDLALPVSGGTLVHAWYAREPYTTWRSTDSSVTAAAAGEVLDVTHGDGDELLVQVLSTDGLLCVYGNLKQVAVRAGDAVQAGDAIGTLLAGQDAVFEVRSNGVSIDPAALWEGA